MNNENLLCDFKFHCSCSQTLRDLDVAVGVEISVPVTCMTDMCLLSDHFRSRKSSSVAFTRYLNIKKRSVNAHYE